MRRKGWRRGKRAAGCNELSVQFLQGRQGPEAGDTKRAKIRVQGEGGEEF